MKAINTLIGRFVLAVGLLAVAEAGLSQSATLAETKEFLSRKLGHGEPNNHGDPCFLHFMTLPHVEEEERPFYWAIINLSTIYLDGIGGPFLHESLTLLKLRKDKEVAINVTKDTETYEWHGTYKGRYWKWKDRLDMGNWRRYQYDDDNQTRVYLRHKSDTSRVIQAIKHAARLCGAKDVTPQLQFE